MFKKLDMELSPKSDCSLPHSDGYLIYSALLELIKSKNEDVSSSIHSEKSGFSISCLDGPFESMNNKPKKKLFSDAKYNVQIGLSGFSDNVVDIFDESVQELIFDSESINIGDGEFEVKSSSLETENVQDILLKSHNFKDPEIKFNFNSPTCIRYGSQGVFEIFPHRMGLFGSLRERWNNIVKDEHNLTFTNDHVGKYVYELDDSYNIRHHKVHVGNYQYDGEKRSIKRRGFTGECKYRLLDETTESLKNAVLILSIVSEYIGVGSDVARGCGDVCVKINDR